MNWDERYRTGEGVGRPPDRFVVDTASTLPPATALDVACGSGRHSLWLAEHGWEVTAIDSSIVALELVQTADPDRRIRTALADLEREAVTLPGRFRLVVQTFFLWRPLWPAIIEAISPGGHYIAVLPTQGMKRPEHMICPGELAHVFNGWNIIVDRVFDGRAEFFVQRPPTS